MALILRMDGSITARDAVNPRRYRILARMASLLALGVADFLSIAGKALKISCSRCNQRDQIMRRVEELGISQALYLIGKTLLMRDFTEAEKQQLAESLSRAQD